MVVYDLTTIRAAGLLRFNAASTLACRGLMVDTPVTGANALR